MLNFGGLYGNRGSETESGRRAGGHNMKETYEIFVKSKKNYKFQTKNKINNEGQLDKILNMVEQMLHDIKLLREQHECNKEISKLREENENV